MLKLKHSILPYVLFQTDPGAKWINNVNMGDDVYFMKHSSNLIIHDDAADAVMIGDITALGHFYGLRRLFRNQNRVSGFIFGQNQADFFPDIDGHSPFEFITTSPQQYQTVISSVEASLPQPTNNTTIYVAGDGEMCKLLHKHLKDELGWNSKQIRAKPFWIHGKRAWSNHARRKCKSAHTHFRPKIRMRASFIPKAWRSPECSASGFRYRENVGQIADWQIESPSGTAASGSDQTRIT